MTSVSLLKLSTTKLLGGTPYFFTGSYSLNISYALSSAQEHLQVVGPVP